MSRVTAPVMRNGFPFLIPQLAEDGKPFEEWDGATVFKPHNPLGTTPDITVYPSKSSSQLVRVYGDGSNYCLKFTLAQLVEFYWRAKIIALSQSGFPVLTGTTSVSVTGGHWVSSGTTWNWVTDSSSASVSGKTLNAEDCVFGFSSDIIPLFGWEWRRDGAFNSNRTITESDLVLQPAGVTYDATGDSHYQVGGFSGRGSNGGIDTGTSESTSCAASNGFSFSLNTGVVGLYNGQDFLGGSACLGPNSWNVIQAAPDEFWYCPIAIFPLQLNPSPESGMPPYGQPASGCGCEAFASGNASATQSVEAGGELQITKGKSWNASACFTNALPYTPEGATDTFSVGGHFPFRVALKSGNVDGKLFGYLSQRTSSQGSAEASIDISLTPVSAIPTIIYGATKYWGYDGLWDEDNGEWQG